MATYCDCEWCQGHLSEAEEAEMREWRKKWAGENDWCIDIRNLDPETVRERMPLGSTHTFVEGYVHELYKITDEVARYRRKT